MEKKVGIVVTGASGWLGQGLLNAMLQGILGLPDLPKLGDAGRIRVLVLPGESEKLPNAIKSSVEVIEGDIRVSADCEKLLRGCEGAVLFHTAGIIHPKKVSEFLGVNLGGTKALLSAAENYGLRRAVVVSSNSPIGCNPSKDHVFDEDTPFEPYMGYGYSKMLMEQYVMEVQSRGILETVRIRAPWFYGPFQPARQSLFFRMIRDGKAPIVGSGENRRSMAYIDNLVQGLLLAAVTPIANGKVYWIADERPYSMNEIINTIESVMEDDFNVRCAHKRIKLPSFASDVAWFVDKGLQKIGVYHQKIHVLSEMNKTIACTVACAKKELNYAPTVSLREGVRRSIEWMRQNGQII